MNTKEIISNSKDITLTEAHVRKSDFCNVWPTAKNGLELLQGIIKNPIAKAAIGIVIAAGDAVSGQICG